MFLDGYLTLEEFELWFFDLAFDVENTMEPPVVRIVHNIEGVLSESSSGHWSRATLISELEKVIAPVERHHPAYELKMDAPLRP
jgi:hypothetical protein